MELLEHLQMTFDISSLTRTLADELADVLGDRELLKLGGVRWMPSLLPLWMGDSDEELGFLVSSSGQTLHHLLLQDIKAFRNVTADDLYSNARGNSLFSHRWRMVGLVMQSFLLLVRALRSVCGRGGRVTQSCVKHDTGIHLLLRLSLLQGLVKIVVLTRHSLKSFKD